jgi:hypothetical protein
LDDDEGVEEVGEVGEGREVVGEGVLRVKVAVMKALQNASKVGKEAMWSVNQTREGPRR